MSCFQFIQTCIATVTELRTEHYVMLSVHPDMYATVTELRTEHYVMPSVHPDMYATVTELRTEHYVMLSVHPDCMPQLLNSELNTMYAFSSSRHVCHSY